MPLRRMPLHLVSSFPVSAPDSCRAPGRLTGASKSLHEGKLNKRQARRHAVSARADGGGERRERGKFAPIAASLPPRRCRIRKGGRQLNAETTFWTTQTQNPAILSRRPL